MKLNFFLLVLVLAMAYSCKMQTRSPIEGAWDMIYVHSVSGDTVQNWPNDSTVGTQMKMWSKGHFAFVGQDKMNDTIITNFYGGGAYKLDGNRYEEDVKYNFNTYYIGKNVKMLLEIINDTLIQTYPVDDNGKIDSSSYAVEKYVRID
jgi:opacity protein-like surface antigen